MRRNTLSYLLLAWLFTVPAVLPLAQPNIPHTADSLLHLYRIVALQQATQQGAFLVRWLPDLAYGYGFPLFVFYAPLSYYLTLALAWLPGLTLTIALNLSFGLALLGATTGTFLFARELLTPRAALVAAVAYVYAPFQLYNAFFRGGLPAAWAMAAFPLTFWLLTRLIRADRFLSSLLPLSALALGLALLMHNTLSLLFVPLLLLYLALALLVLAHNRLAAAGRVLAALALGGGLAAFFLLPALIEKEFAQVERVITSPDFDFRFHFVSLKQLLSSLPPANTGLLNPTVPLTLGPVHAALALLGLSLGVWLWRKQRRPAPLLVLLFAALALAIAIFLMLPLSAPVWEQLPLLAFTQFPHRLLGPSALAIALLAGLAVDALPERPGSWLALAGIALLILSVTPLLYPRYRTNLPPNPTVLDMFAYERAAGAIGTTSFGEYLPAWVTQTPRESPLELQYRQGRPINRLAAEYLPSDTTVDSTSYGFNQAELTVTAAEPHLLIFNSFYFPGWQAWLDDAPATVTPFSERGLIAVGLPAGQHRLRLAFEETPVRRAANFISLMSGGIIITLLGLSLARRPAAILPPAGHRPTNRRELALLAGLALLLIAGKLLVIDNFSTPFKHVFDGAAPPQADTPAQVNFGNQVTLLGYSLPRTTAAAGETFEFTAYWQAQTPLSQNYSALAQLVDDDNHLYAAQDNLHPGGLPTGSWPLWAFVQDTHRLPIPPGTPPGDYWLVTGLYQPTNWSRLPVLAGGQSGWADVFAVPVSVQPPAQPATLAELDIRWLATVDVAAGLRLLGATPERDSIVPGDFLRVALFWEALAAPLPDYQISLRLADAAGAPLAERTARPSHNRYPTPRWSPGERVRDNHALRIPPDAPAGVYRLQLRILDSDDAPLTEWLTVGEMEN